MHARLTSPKGKLYFLTQVREIGVTDLKLSFSNGKKTFNQKLNSLIYFTFMKNSTKPLKDT